ncbi:MAG TPA: Hsp20 family protein, partial [Verrucomicrobiae bacterium]|nr:Hsp20 family protein [Verrucomicrobiae bacterium]
MPNLTRWNPLRELDRWDPAREMEEMENRFARWFGHLPLRRESSREPLTMAEWMPLVDISEDDREYLITAELPEVKKEDVKVRVENHELTIQGERK